MTCSDQYDRKRNPRNRGCKETMDKIWASHKQAYAQGDFRECIEVLTMILEIEETAEAYMLRGDAYLNQGRFDKVYDDQTRAIELDDTHAMAFFKRGILLTRMKMHEQAKEDARTAVALEPENAQNHWLLGGCMMNTYNGSEARESFLRAAQLAPAESMYWESAAQACMYTGRITQAREYFTKAAAYGSKMGTFWLDQLKENPIPEGVPWPWIFDQPQTMQRIEQELKDLLHNIAMKTLHIFIAMKAAHHQIREAVMDILTRNESGGFVEAEPDVWMYFTNHAHNVIGETLEERLILILRPQPLYLDEIYEKTGADTPDKRIEVRTILTSNERGLFLHRGQGVYGLA